MSLKDIMKDKEQLNNLGYQYAEYLTDKKRVHEAIQKLSDQISYLEKHSLFKNNADAEEIVDIEKHKGIIQNIMESISLNNV